jgi:hypothetical protein
MRWLRLLRLHYGLVEASHIPSCMISMNTNCSPRTPLHPYLDLYLSLSLSLFPTAIGVLPPSLLCILACSTVLPFPPTAAATATHTANYSLHITRTTQITNSPHEQSHSPGNGTGVQQRWSGTRNGSTTTKTTVAQHTTVSCTHRHGLSVQLKRQSTEMASIYFLLVLCT